MLSQEVRAALEGELKILNDQRVRIEKKIAGLQAVLADAESFGPALNPPASGSMGGGRYGLSQSIRTLVAQSSNGLRTAEILNGLVAFGFEKGPKLSGKVNSELWRLKKAKKIEKKGRRYVHPELTARKGVNA
jgi:hypothetical protein